MESSGRRIASEPFMGIPGGCINVMVNIIIIVL